MAVEIQLTEKYWLVSDAHSWALAMKINRIRRDKKTGEQLNVTEYRQLTWHATVEQVCQAALERQLRHSDVRTLEELRELAVATAAELRTATQCVDSYSAVKSV